MPKVWPGGFSQQEKRERRERVKREREREEREKREKREQERARERERERKREKDRERERKRERKREEREKERGRERKRQRKKERGRGRGRERERKREKERERKRKKEAEKEREREREKERVGLGVEPEPCNLACTRYIPTSTEPDSAVTRGLTKQPGFTPRRSQSRESRNVRAHRSSQRLNALDHRDDELLPVHVGHLEHGRYPCVDEIGDVLFLYLFLSRGRIIDLMNDAKFGGVEEGA